MYSWSNRPAFCLSKARYASSRSPALRIIEVLRSAVPCGASPPFQGVVSFAITGKPARFAKSRASSSDAGTVACGLGTPRSRQSWCIEYLPASRRGRSACGAGNRNDSRRLSPCSARKMAPASSVVMSTDGRPIRSASRSSPSWTRWECPGSGFQNTRPWRYREFAAGAHGPSCTPNTGTPSRPRLRIAPRTPWCITFGSNLSTTAGVVTSMPPESLSMLDHRAVGAAIELVGGIQHLRAVLHPGVVGAWVHGVDHGEVVVRAGRRWRAADQPAVRKPDTGDQRVVVLHLRAFADQAGDERDRGGLPQVPDAWLVADPDDHHPGASQRAVAGGEDFTGALDDPLGPQIDRLYRLRDQRGGVALLAQLPQQIVRVGRDAVAAHAWARKDSQEAVRLGAGGEGDLHGVQIEGPASVGKIVGQGQRHRAEDVLGQLGGLRGGRRAHQVHGVGQLADHPSRVIGAFQGHATDYPRGLPLKVIGVTRIDPFRAERHEHVGADVHPALLKRLGEHLLGGAGVCRRGQDDRLAGPGGSRSEERRGGKE